MEDLICRQDAHWWHLLQRKYQLREPLVLAAHFH